MTVNEIMKGALALCGEGAAAPQVLALGVPYVNLLIADCFEIEQSIRRAGGKELFENLPLVGELSEEVPYDERLLGAAFVLGVASLIADAGGDRELAADLYAKYRLAAQSAAKAYEHDISDSYGEE